MHINILFLVFTYGNLLYIYLKILRKKKKTKIRNFNKFFVIVIIVDNI